MALLKNWLLMVILIAFLVTGVGIVSATYGEKVVNFDDLVGGGADSYLPVGYAGLSWDPNWFYWSFGQSSYMPHSPYTRIASHNYGGWIDFSPLGEPVIFVGSWFSGDPDVGPQVYFQGYRDGNLIGSSAMITVSEVPTFLEADFGEPVDFVSVNSNTFNWFAMDDLTYIVQKITVDVDIKPDSDPNSINLKSKGVVPVAIITTEDFDAANVDPGTVTLEGIAPVKWEMQDVPEIWDPVLMKFVGDGDLDLVLHFSTEELATTLNIVSTEATLEGETSDGVHIEGTDSVRIVKA
jgi:hypothetical protein